MNWDKYKPSQTVVAVFISGVIAWWVTFVMDVVYDTALNAIDVAINMVWFTTAAGWWTDYNRR